MLVVSRAHATWLFIDSKPRALVGNADVRRGATQARGGQDDAAAVARPELRLVVVPCQLALLCWLRQGRVTV